MFKPRPKVKSAGGSCPFLTRSYIEAIKHSRNSLCVNRAKHLIDKRRLHVLAVFTVSASSTRQTAFLHAGSRYDDWLTRKQFGFKYIPSTIYSTSPAAAGGTAPRPSHSSSEEDRQTRLLDAQNRRRLSSSSFGSRDIGGGGTGNLYLGISSKPQDEGSVRWEARPRRYSRVISATTAAAPPHRYVASTGANLTARRDSSAEVRWRMRRFDL